MDALTASLALIIAQTCTVLVMVGAHLAARPERATGYWASSATLVLVGILLIVASRRFPVLQLFGSSALVFGTVLQLSGLQAFYKVKQGATGWAIGACTSLLFIVLVAMNAPLDQHIILFATALLVLLAMSLRVLLAGIRSHWTFASVLTLGAMVLMMANNMLRIVEAIVRPPTQLVTESPLGIATLYMVPLGGIFLFATGLLLLYFERLVEEKHSLATHDELTGLLNRRAIVTAGEREVAVAIRHRRPLTVAFVDIDYLKTVNDSFGHEAGDMVIADVSKILRDACRGVDLVARYGGDEFCLVLPCAGSDSAADMGGRLMRAVREYSFRDQPPLTLSIGFASLTPEGDRSWASLIRRADMALYQAKQMGRNQFCIDTTEIIN